MAQGRTQAASDERPHIKLGSQRGIYHVSSKSKPGTWHVVNVQRGTCSCEAAHFGRACWHLRYCQQYDVALSRARATQPTPRPAFTLNPPVAPGAGMAALLECFV